MERIDTDQDQPKWWRAGKYLKETKKKEEQTIKSRTNLNGGELEKILMKEKEINKNIGKDCRLG